jgi:hypothetical protein
MKNKEVNLTHLVGREIWSYTQPSKFREYCFTFKSLLLEESSEMGKKRWMVSCGLLCVDSSLVHPFYGP